MHSVSAEIAVNPLYHLNLAANPNLSDIKPTQIDRAVAYGRYVSLVDDSTDGSLSNALACSTLFIDELRKLMVIAKLDITDEEFYLKPKLKPKYIAIEDAMRNAFLAGLYLGAGVR